MLEGLLVVHGVLKAQVMCLWCVMEGQLASWSCYNMSGQGHVGGTDCSPWSNRGTSDVSLECDGGPVGLMELL